jgi:ketosteroid isomerase-like protein
MTNLERAKSYFAAIQARGDLGAYFSPDVVQREFPNRLVPNGATRDRAALDEARERGRHAVESERYEVVNAIEQDDRLALEVIWTATLLVPVGSVPAGGTLRAHFGVFLRYRDGLIVAQHNYDCFDPF